MQIYGYLIVKKYEVLFDDFIQKGEIDLPLYGVPCISKKIDQYDKKYRGIDREALSGYEKSNILAEIRMSELENEKIIEDGIIKDKKYINDILSYLDKKEDYEVIWMKTADCEESAPEGYSSIGYEYTYFISDHFSINCDSLFFLRWHGTDNEGVLFKKYYDNLNKYGLFNTIIEAKEYLDYYLSFDWTERGDFYPTQVFIQNYMGHYT